MIRDNKVHQIDGVICHLRSGADALYGPEPSGALQDSDRITRETALKYASNADMLKRRLIVSSLLGIPLPDM